VDWLETLQANRQQYVGAALRCGQLGEFSELVEFVKLDELVKSSSGRAEWTVF